MSFCIHGVFVWLLVIWIAAGSLALLTIFFQVCRRRYHTLFPVPLSSLPPPPSFPHSLLSSLSASSSPTLVPFLLQVSVPLRPSVGRSTNYLLKSLTLKRY